MSNAIRSLVVKVGADLTGFKSGMTTATAGVNKFTTQVQTSQKTLSSFSTTMRSLFAGVSTIAILAGLTRFTKASLQLASDLVEVQNVVDVTFGENAKTIDKFAEEAGKSFGLTELAAKKYSGTMGAMLKSSGLAGAQLVDMSTKLTGLAGDFASFYNLTSEEAFTKIRSGISGETEPLKQIGINLSVANLEAFALSQGVKASYDSMDQASKTILRYNYLLSVSRDAQNDFTRTSGSYANQLRIADLNMQSFSATMGSGFMNIAYGVVRAFNDMSASLQVFAQKFEIFTRIWFGDAKAMSSAGGVAVDTTNDLAAAQDNLAKAITGSSAAAKGSLAGFDKLNVLQRQSAGGGAVGGSLGALGSYLGKLGEVNTATGGITGKLEEWTKKLQAAHDWLYNLGGDIYNFWAKWDAFWRDQGSKLATHAENFTRWMTGGKYGVAEFGKAWDDYWQGVGRGIYNIADKYARFISGGKKGINEMSADWGQMFINIGKWIMGAGGSIYNVLDKTGKFILNLPKLVKDAFPGIKTTVLTAGQKIYDFFKGIGDYILALPSKIAKMFNVNLPDWYYVLTGQKKPSTQPYTTGNTTNPRQMRQFAVGTDYVPFTGPAIVHQGERIIPAGQNNDSALLRQILAAIQSQRMSVSIGDEHLSDYVAKSSNRLALQRG